MLVLGVSGLTGFKLSQLARNRFVTYGTYNMRSPSSNELSFKLDVTDEEGLRGLVHQIKPDLIINATALHNVDYCETHPEEAFAVNAKVVAKVAALCNNIGARLVHISTDFVFDGMKNSPYIESDEPNPISIYGESKLEGEGHAKTSSSYSILRPSVVYGWTPLETRRSLSSSGKSVNFAIWIIEEMIKKREVKIVEDQFSTPTLADVLAMVALRVGKREINGLYHVCSSHCINRYDFAKKIVDTMGYSSELVVPIGSGDLNQLAKRPSNSCLNSEKLENDLSYKLPNVDQSVAIMRSQIEYEAPSLLSNRG